MICASISPSSAPCSASTAIVEWPTRLLPEPIITKAGRILDRQNVQAIDARSRVKQSLFDNLLDRHLLIPEKPPNTDLASSIPAHAAHRDPSRPKLDKTIMQEAPGLIQTTIPKMRHTTIHISNSRSCANSRNGESESAENEKTQSSRKQNEMCAYGSPQEREGSKGLFQEKRDDGRGKFPGPMHLALATRRHKWSFIAKADFEPRRLLNKSEYRILQILEKITREVGGRPSRHGPNQLGLKLLPQDRIRIGRKRATLRFARSTASALDFLIIDHSGLPALAVEHQGHGHYQNRAFMRDAVKREAVRKAKVKFLEIPAEYDARVLEEQIRSVLLPNPGRQRAL